MPCDRALTVPTGLAPCCWGNPIACPELTCTLGVSHPACYHLAVKTIQIRNVPEPIHRVLRTRAAAAGVSLSDYALAELERVAARPPVGDVLARAESRAGGVATEVIVSAVRSGRDRV